MLLACCVVLGFLALSPDCAAAWGPISHLAHGTEILKRLTTLDSGLQQLLSAAPVAYLYGCIGADITLAKKYTRRLQAHCHSWPVAWQLLAAAESENERAFAYGYLTHLAADVFSHNHFIPTQLIVSFRARALRHLYWEARFDSLQSVEYRDVLHRLRRQRFPECEELLKRVVARTIIPFQTGKQIFDSVLAFHDWDNWHRVMHQVTLRSRYDLPASLVTRYNVVCLHHAEDVLRQGVAARCQAADPSGLETLTMAKSLRRTLKLLARRRAVTAQIERQLEHLNQRLDLDSDSPSDVPLGIAHALG